MIVLCYKNTLKFLIYLVLSFTLISLSGCESDNKYDMSSLDNDIDDESDFEEYIASAKRSARNERFSSAYSYLENARKLGVSRSELASAKRYVQNKKEAYEERIERERQGSFKLERQANNDTNGNTGGSLNCARVSGDSALWKYCEKGSCDGFSSNHGLWTLCERNSASGLTDNSKVWSYLENGQTGGFSGVAFNLAEQNKGSFIERKRFVIYYLRGFVLYNY